MHYMQREIHSKIKPEDSCYQKAQTQPLGLILSFQLLLIQDGGSKPGAPTQQPAISCEYCQKPFRYKSSYLEHVMIHTGERPFMCDYCSFRFTRRSNLKNHLLTVHRDLSGGVSGNKKKKNKEAAIAETEPEKQS